MANRAMEKQGVEEKGRSYLGRIVGGGLKRVKKGALETVLSLGLLGPSSALTCVQELPVVPLGEDNCAQVFYESAGWPQGFGVVRLEVGNQEHCVGISQFHHTVNHIPVVPFTLPIAHSVEDGCANCNSAPSLTVESPSTDGLEDLCATTDNLFAGDVSLRVSVEDDEPIFASAFVYDNLGDLNNMAPSTDLVVESSGVGDSFEGRYRINANFSVRAAEGVSEDQIRNGGLRYFVVFSGNKDRTVTNARILNFAGDGSCTDNVGGLGDVARYACENLPRSQDDPATSTRDEGDFINLFRVYTNGDGSFNHEEVSRLDPHDPLSGGIHTHIFNGSLPDYWIAVAGESSGNVASMTSGADELGSGDGTYNPENCREIIFYNRNGFPISRGGFTTTVNLEDGDVTAEEHRSSYP